MTELEMYKKAHTLLFNKLNEVASRWFCDQVAEEVNAIFEPPQKFENVEVVRLMCDKCQRVQGPGFNPAVEVCFCHETGAPLDQWTYTELKGCIRRPVPQKVARSVSIPALIGDGLKYSSGAGIGLKEGHKDQLFEFADYPECHGKRGVLTFTWTK